MTETLKQVAPPSASVGVQAFESKQKCLVDAATDTDELVRKQDARILFGASLSDGEPDEDAPPQTSPEESKKRKPTKPKKAKKTKKKMTSKADTRIESDSDQPEEQTIAQPEITTKS